jgi:DNA-binding response OmpR family regulator
MQDQTEKKGVVLVVDDEPDVLATVQELLNNFIVHTAKDFETARQYIMTFTYDVVILDIMGVNGFELLKLAVLRNFPTIMFTAHALNPEALKASIKLGAVAYVPKTEINHLPEMVEELMRAPRQPLWRKVFERFISSFDKSFGDDWREKDRFLKEFQEQLKAKDGA